MPSLYRSLREAEIGLRLLPVLQVPGLLRPQKFPKRLRRCFPLLPRYRLLPARWARSEQGTEILKLNWSSGLLELDT